MADYIRAADYQGRLKDSLARLYKLPDEQADLDSDVAAAESEVNAYVGARLAIPVTDARAAALLRKLSLDLFEEKAWSRGKGDALPQKITDQAKAARELLDKIASGKVSVAGAANLTEQSAGADAILVDGPDPEFTAEKMEGY